MRLTLGFAAQALGCPLPSSGAGAPVAGVCIDSRRVKSGDIFFCIPGENFDGHDFALGAAASGAAAVVAEKSKISDSSLPGADAAPVPVLHVEEAVPALGKLARAWRDETRARVVAITGSAGKTTVKELLAQVLEQDGPVARNPMNLNNQIGLPLSMLAATGEEKYWVMEVGISLPGDMAELGRILNPDIALVLNVGPAHLSGLGDRGVAYYKAQLLSFLAEGGIGIVCADYPDLVNEAKRRRPNPVLFTARGGDAPYGGSYLGQGPDGLGRYQLRLADKIFQATAPLPGAMGAENIAAVAAIADTLGFTEELIAGGLAGASPPAQRFSRGRVGGWLLVDDSYNANPLSCRRALAAAAELAASLPLVLVMGEMGELGDAAAELHLELGGEMARARPKAVFWKGGHLPSVKAGLAGGGWSGEVLATGEESFQERFAGLGLERGVILFKGSRLNRLERLVEIFRRNNADKKDG